MIYVFDDRYQRRTINEEKLNRFSELVKFDPIKIESGKSIEECVIDSVDNPDCIIFHKSYAFGNKDVTFEAVRQLFTSFNIPIVIFSGGTEGSSRGDIEMNMNADIMYENLPFFLDDFKSNGKVNIDTLLWGKRYKLNAMLQLQNELSKTYLVNSDLEGMMEQIGEVQRTITVNCRKFGLENVGEKIIATLKALQHPTWLDLANIIENNIKDQN